MILKALTRLRYVSFIAVFFSFVASVLMFVIGGVKVAKAVWQYVRGIPADTLPPHQTPTDAVTIQVIASLDAFLIALALLYFGYGIYALMAEPKVMEGAPKWLVPKSLKDLKETLAHVVIIILFVLFLDVEWMTLHDPEWERLVLPLSIALLALSLKLMGLKESD